MERVAGLLEKHRNIQSLHSRTISNDSFFLNLFNRLDIDWQKKCLDLPARRKYQNLIYTLPTSGGKVEISIIQDTSNAVSFRR
jgi:CRISPR/Cas system-associated endonuclease/helicase Cas3